ncbi:MAG: PAS domain S-box protein [Gammaproteobacteria bacterium]|nr:PAS domain S-box protein [Gammaproteobacteria bacterium]
MEIPCIPENETERLAALQHLELLDTLPENRFDRLTRIVKQHFQVSIALVSLVDRDRQWFKSRQGLDATETPRDISFCGHAILSDDIFYIRNTLEDVRFADNPLVTGAPNIRFYAGAPLHTPDGSRIGTLCIIDDKPREFSAQALSVLRDLADTVEAELERSRLLELSQSLQRSEDRLTHLVQATLGIIVSCQVSADCPLQFISSSSGQVFGYPPQPFMTDLSFWIDHVHADDRQQVRQHLQQLLQLEDLAFEYRFLHADGDYHWVHDQRHLIRDSHGQADEIVGLWSDITERKQHEKRIQEQNRLLDTISRAQSRFIQSSNIRLAFDEILSDLLSITDSEYGFIGEILRREDDTPYLKTYALTDIAWDDDTRLLYQQQAAEGMEFSNLDTLFGAAITSGEVVISNDPAHDPRSGGIPAGHPPLNAFLGIPFYRNSQMIGMVGLANRVHGYDQALVNFLAPFISTMGTLVEAIRNEQQRAKVSDELAGFKHILDSTLDMIFMFDADSLQFVYLNKGAVESMGYSEQELLGLHPYDIKPHLTEHEFRQLIAPLSAGRQKTLNFETVHRTRDGRDFPVEIFLQLVHENENTARFIAIVRDITERKQTEEALQDVVAIRQAILDSANFSIISTDTVGVIQSFNRHAETLLGYSAEELVNKQSPALLHELDEVVARAAQLSAELETTIEPGFEVFVAKARLGSADENEWTYRCKDGRRFPVLLSVTALKDAQGNITGFLGVASDITERKQAEIALKDSESRIHAIVDTVVDGIITINSAGIVQTMNPAAERIFDYSADLVVGKNVNMLMPAPYSTEHDGYLSHYIQTSQARVIGIGREVEGRRSDGSTFPMDLAVSEMHIHGQRMFTGIVRDITERKRMDQMKKEFISTVSHELRTPLTSIRGALGLVLGGAVGEIPEKAKNMLQMANRNSERLTLLINDILDLEKIESGRMDFNLKLLDLAALTRVALEANNGYALEHGVKLSFTGETSSVMVNADENRLLQVFANFISNAVKFSAKQQTVEIELSKNEGWVRVSVCDHGLGIPDEFRSRIFQRFAQADSSDTRQKGGSGLGLSISKAIIEHLDGQIGFESTAGKGSTFYFELAQVDRVAASDSTSSGKLRILICEDNPDVSQVLSAMLKNEGMNCDIASSAAGAKALLKTRHYQVMLLDLGLPDQNGLELITELKQDEQTRDLPIIVVSALAEESRAVFRGDVITVVDWIQKPVDKTRLINALNDTFSGTEKPQILHVEDSLDIVQVTAEIIGDMAEYHYATSLATARAFLQDHRIDLLILDIALPDGSGLELLDSIRYDCPVMVFSGQEVDKQFKSDLAAVLTKSTTSNEQLLTTIRKLIFSSRDKA